MTSTIDPIVTLSHCDGRPDEEARLSDLRARRDRLMGEVFALALAIGRHDESTCAAFARQLDELD